MDSALAGHTDAHVSAAPSRYLVQDFVNELHILGKRRCEQQKLEEEICTCESFAQSLVDTSSLKESSIKLKRDFLEAAAANASESSKSSRSRLSSTREEYVLALRKRLVQNENDLKRLREHKQKRSEELQRLSQDSNGTQRSHRLAIQELYQHLVGTGAACPKWVQIPCGTSQCREHGVPQAIYAKHEH
jgi:hypothetical protein